MEKLKELVNIVTRNKVKAIEVIGFSNDNHTKINQLYEGIQSGQYNNDEDAFEALYGEDCDKNPYYKLKYNLKERLYNTLFFIDIKSSKYSDIKRANLYVQKMISLFNLLRAKDAKLNAIAIGEKVIQTAMEYEFALEVIHLARQLRSLYALVIGDRKKYLYYHSLIIKYQRIAEAEAMAEGYYYDIISLYIKNKSTKEESVKIASMYLDDLNQVKLEFETAHFFYCKTMIAISLYMGQNDYRKTLEICDQSLAKLKTFSFEKTGASLVINTQKIACCIQLKLYQEGRKVILGYIEKIPEGIFNWFKMHELYLTLCLHTKSYQEAYEVYEKATQHPKFSKFPKYAREVWKIFQAWIHFLSVAGKISKEKRSKFRVSKYVNEVPIFSKDKRGLNIPILISQIVLLLQQKRYDALIDRVEAIEKYKDRYLDKENNFRSNVFVRLLLEIPKRNFSFTQISRKTEKLVARLNEAPLEIANQSHDLEILPYEDTWEIILDELWKR